MIKINFLVFFVYLLLYSCSNNKPSPVKVFHANLEHSGVYAGDGRIQFDSLRWKFKTGGKIFSSPVIYDDVSYVGSEDSNLYSLQAADGKLNWKFKTRGAVSSTPAVYENTVYFTSYDGFCYALDLKTGTEIWKFKTAGEKKVGAKGLWTMKPAELYMEDLWDFFLSSPILDANDEPTVYFGSSDENLYAVDAISGKEKWRFKTNGIIHTSPALSKGTIFFGSWDTYFYALDAKTGKEKWKFKTKDQPDYHVLEGIQASATIADSIVYFGARDGYFYALNILTGKMIWNFSADNSWILTTAAIRDGTIYLGTSDTYLMIALDAITGAKKYSMKAKGYLYSSPAIVGQTAFYGDFTGNMYALDLNSEGNSWTLFSTESRKENAGRILNLKGDLDFTFTAGVQDLSLYESSVDVMNEFYTLGSIVSSPAISGNTIFFGSTDGYLYAVGLKNYSANR